MGKQKAFREGKNISPTTQIFPSSKPVISIEPTSNTTEIELSNFQCVLSTQESALLYFFLTKELSKNPISSQKEKKTTRSIFCLVSSSSSNIVCPSVKLFLSPLEVSADQECCHQSQERAYLCNPALSYFIGWGGGKTLESGSHKIGKYIERGVKCVCLSS